MTARYNKGKLNISMNNAYFSADTMVMWLIPIIFAALTLWFSPLTAAFSYDGRWRVFWLPRVWCGFALPRHLSLSGKKSRRSPCRLPLRFWCSLGRRLLVRLRPFRFRLCPAPCGFYFHCIAGVTVGHIIISIAGAALHHTGRRKRKRRKLWPLNGR